MKPSYEVDMDDDDMVTIRMNRWVAVAMAETLRSVLPRHVSDNETGRRMRGVARAIVGATRPKRERSYDRYYYYRFRVPRPPSSTSSEVDMDHVLYGGAPYPVLSVPDMKEVYPLLEERRLSAARIAERLHVAPRTVVRWRLATREEKE